MLIKAVGLLLIIIGIAGLILPIIPGILLTTIGVLLLFNDRIGEIRRLLPEKMPAAAAVVYSFLTARLLAPHYKRISEDVHFSKGASCLDIGTGPGILPIVLAKKFPDSKIIGIDLSEKMIEIAIRNKLRILRQSSGFVPRSPERSEGSEVEGRTTKLENLEFKIMDAKSLEFPDNSFDLIISTGSLHHWKEPSRVLDEIYRCLKPGGEALVYDGCTDAENINFLLRYILNIHGFTKKEYEMLVVDIVGRSRFKTASFEERGIMMRIKLDKKS